MGDFLLLNIILIALTRITDSINDPDLSKSNPYVCSISSRFHKQEDSFRMVAPPILNLHTFYQEITGNGTFEVECTGHKPLTWIIHNYGNASSTSVINVSEMEHGTNSTKLYSSKLSISKPIYMDTRLYHCVYNEEDQWNTQNSFYLYVNDDANLLLPIASEIIFCDSHESTIPCRPTNSRSNVTLWKSVGGQPIFQIPQGKSDLPYDPSEGYRISQPSFFYDGEFVCQAELDGQIQTRDIRIDFHGIYPTLSIQTEIDKVEATKYFLANNNHKIKCIVNTYKGDDVWFEWRNCNNTKCTQFGPKIILETDEKIKELPKKNHIFQFQNLIEINATESGELICVCGRNLYMIESETLIFTVTDIAYGFGILSPTTRPVEGDNITIECRANLIHYSKIEFTHSSSIRNADYVENNNYSTPYSMASKITFYNIDKKFNQTVICIAKPVKGKQIQSQEISLIAQPATKPKFLKANYEKSIKLRQGSSQPLLDCSASGAPTPKTNWFKDKKPITNNSAMDIIGDGQVLRIKLLTKDLVEGDYFCDVFNRIESISRSFKIEDNEVSSATIIWAVILSVGLVIILIAVACCVRLIRQKKLEKAELNALVYDLNHGGRLDKVDPNLPIDEQVEYLPYDKKWEFNENRLRLGIILGQGAFGKVVQAQAIGIIGDDTISVAVKTTKDRANIPQMKLLISELKILVHLGKHLNIANLLGAVTKNIIKGDLMIITEFCRFGNLRSFLINAKNKFVNQVNQETGLIDLNIKNDNDAAIVNDNLISNIDVEFNNSDGGLITSLGSSSEVEWKTVSTTDLISYSYQVSKGMNFLSSKKILHRDLAARNVLLADNNIVKICDFGLAKDCYHTNYYKLQGNGALPIKWLALESLEKKVFTTQSDVWSYGIFLWELFTLGGDPYPGMNIDEDFFIRLKRGYRMASPEYAPKNIYNAMLRCWNENPDNRPTFETLGEEIGNVIQETQQDVYLQLETEYTKISALRLEDENKQETKTEDENPKEIEVQSKTIHATTSEKTIQIL